MEASSPSPTLLAEGSPADAARPASWREELVGYAWAAALSVALTALLYQTWSMHWSTPLRYQGDSISHAMWIKSTLEHGSYLYNPALGAPHGQEMHDFPQIEGLPFLLATLLSYVFADPMAVFNAY